MSVNTVIGDVSEAGKRGVDTRDVFVAKQEAYQDDIANNFVSQVNAVGQEINTTVSEINAKSANVDAKNANVNTQAQIATDKSNEAAESARKAEAAVPIGDSYNQTTIDAKNAAQNQAIYTSNGYIDSHKKDDLFEEIIIPNTLQLKKEVDVIVNGVLGTIGSGTQIVLPLAPFDTVSNDKIYPSGSLTTLFHNSKDIIIQEDGDLIWQFLKEVSNGTTFASLVENTDYKVLDEVARQDIFYIAKSANGTPQYKSIKGLKYDSDKDILNHDLIASDSGWTKLDNNLYSDGTDEITEITIIPRLNAGAYHPEFNSFGCLAKQRSDGLYGFWYDPLQDNNSSVYQNFQSDIAIITGSRLDNKLYYLLYLEGENGIIYKPSSAKEIHESALVQEWQRDCVSDLDGINSQNNNAYFTTQGTALAVENLTDTAKVLWDLSNKAIEVKQVLYTTDNGATWNTETFTLDSINNQITLGNARAEIKVSYVAQNQTLQQQDPIEILAVGNQAIFSNSNDILQGNSLIESATGKIATSNTLNRVESKTLENIIFDEDNAIITTPNHNASLLNSDNSTAFKGIPFVGLASNNELVVGMFTEEGKYNASGYGWNTGVGLTFQQLVNGLVDGVYENDLKSTILYKRTGRFKK